MARRHGVPGAGRDANKGISGGRKDRLQEAINSVPKLQWGPKGIVHLQNVTRQQRTGLEWSAKKWGWTLDWSGNDVTITHVALHDKFLARQERRELKAKIKAIGFIQFNRGSARFEATTQDEHDGIVGLCEKYGWEYMVNDNVYIIAKTARAA